MRLPLKIKESTSKHAECKYDNYHTLFDASPTINCMYLINKQEMIRTEGSVFKWVLPQLSGFRLGRTRAVYDNEYGLLMFS